MKLKICKWCKKEFEDTTTRKKMVYCCRGCYQHNENAKARAKTAAKIPPKIGNCCKKCGGEKETRQSHYCRDCKNTKKREYQISWKIKKGLPVLTEEKIQARIEKAPMIQQAKEEKQERKHKREIKQLTNKEKRERKIKRLNKGVIEDGRDINEILEHESKYESREKKAVIVQRDYTKKERQLIDDFFKNSCR